MFHYRNDLKKFETHLSEGKNFALSRFGEGEFFIIKGIGIDNLEKENGEYIYTPNGSDEYYRQQLVAALQYRADNYFVGIGCPCCCGKRASLVLKKLSGQHHRNLTWSNIWRDANYEYFLENILPLFRHYRTTLICNHKADTKRLPFTPEQVFYVGSNAWVNDFSLCDTLKNQIESRQLENHLFLFCGGPLANILVHQLSRLNGNNTYLDLGSVLDPFLFESNGMTRTYLVPNHRKLSFCQGVSLWNYYLLYPIIDRFYHNVSNVRQLEKP